MVPKGFGSPSTDGPWTVHRAGRARGSEQRAGRKAYYQVLTARLEARVGMGPAGGVQSLLGPRALAPTTNAWPLAV
jgi:hypothetical protein